MAIIEAAAIAAAFVSPFTTALLGNVIFLIGYPSDNTKSGFTDKLLTLSKKTLLLQYPMHTYLFHHLYIKIFYKI